MELQHFSHEHPLILSEERDDKDGICFGCRKPISSHPAYICKPCSFFLHKTCAEQPQEIKHLVDSQHTLLLHKAPPYTNKKSCSCNVCRERWDYFTYHCSICDIDVCMCCALEERKIMHDSHEHELMLLRRPAIFFCNACGTEAKDSSYVCANCDFWIHKNCASLPSTTRHPRHDHLLVLGYSLPDALRRSDYLCQICDEKMHPPYWIYQCPDCRYAAHVKCATSLTEESLSSVEGDTEAKENPGQSLVPLPVTDVSTDLITTFVKQICSIDIQNAAGINHPSHDEHPLFLSAVQNHNETKNNILCNCCIEPIQEEFYTCASCSYFLHLCCAALPEKLQQHTGHPEHPLFLGRFPNFYDLFMCNACAKLSNGFFYGCKTCEFRLDIKCASLPKVITHEGHRHPLTQSIHLEHECNSCRIPSSGFAMRCADCNFHICYTCALLPRTVKHRWDKHPLPLIYPPVANHPDEFYCEICEEEFHPRDWLYHCRDCDQSFHPRCVCLLDEYPNVKFGDSLPVKNHPHHLTFLRRSKARSSCNACGKCLDGYTVFKCMSCNFHLCRQCIHDRRS